MSTPDSSASFLESLPVEVLTSIISYVPLEYVPQLRSVSRGLRDCAWVSFARCLTRKITFDIRSRKDMNTLQEISQNRQLAPHITYLAFATGHARIPVDELEDDIWEHFKNDSRSKQKVHKSLKDHRAREKHRFVKEDVFVTYAPQYQAGLQKQMRLRGKLVDGLSSILREFKQLVSIQYKDSYLPKDFFPIISDLERALFKLDLSLEDFTCNETRIQWLFMDLNGADIVLQSLAAADVKVKDLTIPAVIRSCEYFISPTSPSIMKTLLASVERLTLSHLIYEEVADAEGLPERLQLANEHFLTGELAPRLQSFVLNEWSPDIEEERIERIKCLPPNATYPPIRRLELPFPYLQCDDWLPKFSPGGIIRYLRKVAPTLQELALSISPGVDWTLLIGSFATSREAKLKQLEIRDIIRSGLDHYGESRGYVAGMSSVVTYQIPSRETVYAAAETVCLMPPSLKEDLENYWNDLEESLSWRQPITGGDMA